MGGLNGVGSPVELFGGVRMVRFSINQLIEIEEHFGSIDGVKGQLDSKPVTATRFLLWVALSDPQLALEATGDLMEGIDFRELHQALVTELLKAFGQSLESKEDTGEQPTGPTVSEPASDSPSPVS